MEAARLVYREIRALNPELSTGIDNHSIDNYIQSVRFATYVKYRLLHAKSAIMSECGARGYILSLFAWNKVFKARLSCHLIVPHVYIATLFENDESEKRA